RITGVEPESWAIIKTAIGPLISETLGRLDQERLQASAKRERKVAAGMKGARARWGEHGNTNSPANGKPDSKSIATAMAEPMRNQWPPAPAPDEVRYEERLVPTRTREENEYPFDPPETVEQGRRFLEGKGVKPQDMEAKLTKLMAFRLYPSEVAA
ncbi:hypothetical protein AB4144_23115, partial [Rhizobiaceae sp. 2RAB30]